MAVERAKRVPTTDGRARHTGAPLVSAIIPVHNGERFLGDAIRSVLDQTYDAVECVVVDDGSTDRSASVAASFGERVRVLRKPHGGVASARNAGVAATSGPLVAFLDADDIWLPEKLERQVRCWQASPQAGMVYTGFAVANGDGGRLRYRILATEPQERIRAATLLEGYGIAFGLTALVARGALEALGPFDERLSVSADVAYAWWLLQQVAVVAIPEPLAVYRLHGRSQMHNDLGALEHDRRIVAHEAFPEGTPERWRATANLHTHLTYRWLLRGDLQRAVQHARLTVSLEPARLVTLPVAAIRRRVTRRLLGRWPAVPAREPVLSAPSQTTQRAPAPRSPRAQSRAHRSGAPSPGRVTVPSSSRSPRP